MGIVLVIIGLNLMLVAIIWTIVVAVLPEGSRATKIAASIFLPSKRLTKILWWTFAALAVSYTFLEESGILWLGLLLSPTLIGFVIVWIVSSFRTLETSPKESGSILIIFALALLVFSQGWQVRASQFVHLWWSVPSLHPTESDKNSFCHADRSGRFFVFIGAWGIDNSAWYVFDPTIRPSPAIRPRVDLPWDLITGPRKGTTHIYSHWYRLHVKGYAREPRPCNLNH